LFGDELGIMYRDTIVAIATPLGMGGISIVKISGPEAVNTVTPIFRPHNAQRQLAFLPSQTMIYGHIYHADSSVLVDEVLLTILRKPRSFTGEDIVEINCHGGLQVTRAILDMLIKSGLRLAEPGEFTRRAFLNGRIDLTQVEGTIDLIHARTRRAARLGSQMVARGIGDEIRRLLDIVIELRAGIEATIDFNDDIDSEGLHPYLKERILSGLVLPVENMVRHYHDGRLLREGLRVVLAGKPNVGKSSLMNQLLNHDRAIVTDIPGTTRDTIEESIHIKGIPIRISDTAGLRISDDPLERMGQKKAQIAIENADLILFMIDGSQPLDDNDRQLLSKMSHRSYVVVRNKIDLLSDIKIATVLDVAPAGGYLDISALNGSGLQRLKARLLEVAGMDDRAETEAFLPNIRQRELLKGALEALSRAAEPVMGSESVETIAMDLRDCQRAFNKILGIDVEQDVLDDIFARFCIGK
jgi:tRNA modification GTPase